MEALKFASEKHIFQRRKGNDKVPYINHLINVACLLQSIGGENSEELLAAAILHDILEDTDTSQKELSDAFGDKVASLVAEVTDDMSLTYDDRKREQIHKAPYLSNEAKKIKIADKISNISDILHYPLTWSVRRKIQYIDWSEEVIKHCKGVNINLDNEFERIIKKARTEINS